MERRTLARRAIVLVGGVETMVDSVTSPALGYARLSQSVGEDVRIVARQIERSALEFGRFTGAVRFVGLVNAIIDPIAVHRVIDARSIGASERRWSARGTGLLVTRITAVIDTIAPIGERNTMPVVAFELPHRITRALHLVTVVATIVDTVTSP